ncbi:MAG: tRNA uridine-5-carboxymethylaminomethyl(34) synthesis GTPase MnmE, partial [Bacteroidia bacterium]
MILNDTIVALATPSGIGAIGLIRVSGTATFEIIEKMLHKSIKGKKSHSIVLRELYDTEGVIDEVLISV